MEACSYGPVRDNIFVHKRCRQGNLYSGEGSWQRNPYSGEGHYAEKSLITGGSLYRICSCQSALWLVVLKIITFCFVFTLRLNLTDNCTSTCIFIPAFGHCAFQTLVEPFFVRVFCKFLQDFNAKRRKMILGLIYKCWLTKTLASPLGNWWNHVFR